MSTYYDSQSGLHVALHNEREISLFFDWRQSHRRISMVNDWKASGVQGLIVNELETLGELPTAFRLFSYSTPPPPEFESRFSHIIPYTHLDNKEVSLPGKSITFELGDECFDQEPILIANHVARVIDEIMSTTMQDETFLWLAQSSSIDADRVLSLCEELMYLDLPGSPVKARLLVNATEDEVVEETMLLGVNKFVASQQEQIEWVKDLAKQQGKNLVGY